MIAKHADLLILTVVVVTVLIGVVAYERNQSAVVAGASAFAGELPDTYGSPIGAVRFPAVAFAGATERPESGNTLPAPEEFEAGTIHLGQGAALGGVRPFPDENPWNVDISQRPVDPLSDLIIQSIGRDKNLHPDFGAQFWSGAPNGIPYVVVSGNQPRVPIVYTAYGDESDAGPFPIPPGAPIEGAPNEDGDRHVLVVDRDNWMLYELFRAFPVGNGEFWRAESGAAFNLKTGELRPEGWTSADAAGLPIFPGLVRYDEVVELGEIRHALRFTVSRSRRAYIPPARHWASRNGDPMLPPMGMRVRLKQGFDTSLFPKQAQVILTALKKYGMIVADNVSDWFLSGAPDPRWDDEALRTLKKVKGRDFEVVQMLGTVSGP